MKILKNNLSKDYKIRTEMDFPVKGIEFIDINSLIMNGDALSEIIDLFVEEVAKRELQAVVMMTDCQGMCDREPVVKIINTDGSIVLYANVTKDKVNKIIEEHIINGNVCKDLLA